MNLISFANFNPSENQTSLLPAIEKDGKPEDFSTILNNIFVALQTANSPAANFSSGFEQSDLQIQTVSENGQNVVFGSNPAFAETAFVQTANQDLKTNLNQTFFSPNLNVELNQPANLTTESVNLTSQTDSTVSFSPTEKLISIPTNFQPLPKIPTMPNLVSENPVDSNLPRVFTSQNPLPDLQNIMKLSQIATDNQDLQNPVITEEAKGFEIIPKSDDIFSKQKFSFRTDLPSNSNIIEENIFPETSNLPNTNFSVSGNSVNVEAAYTKNPQFKPTDEMIVIETNVKVSDEKRNFALNLNQLTNTSNSKPKSEFLNTPPNLNSVLEYPTKPKADLPQNQEINLVQKVNFTQIQETEYLLNQKVDLPQNPINPQIFEIKADVVSNDFPVQAEIQNPQPNVEVKTESIPEVDVIETLPTEQIDIQPNLKPEIPSPIKPIETKPEISNPELNFKQNVGEVTDSVVEKLPKLENEISVEAPALKIENHKPNLETKVLNSKTEVQSDILNAEVTVPTVSNEVQTNIENQTVSKIVQPEIEVKPETKVNSEIESYQIKPLDFISQNEEIIPANQKTQDVLLNEVSKNELTADNPVNFKSPVEQNNSSATFDKAIPLNVENSEPILPTSTNIEPQNNTPQINPEMIVPTDFAEKIDSPQIKIVSEEVKKTVDDLSFNLKNQVLNNELPKNQKQIQSQEVSVNESAQTESGIKITETHSSNSSQEFTFSEKPKQDSKFNESENDLTINFDRIFENVIKKKEGVEATPKPQTEPAKIAEQINPRLLEMATSVEKKDEKEILKLRLHPAELGTVEITLERDSSGVLNAHFKTETEGAREVLSNGLEMLRESLQKAGWEVGQMDISNGSNSSTNNQNRQNQQQKSEWIENFIFNRSAEQPDESENNSPTRLLNLLA